MIEAQKLTKIFDGKKALNGVDIKINSGSIYGKQGKEQPKTTAHQSAC